MINKNLLLAALCIAVGIGDSMAADPEVFWFKNETTCADTKVTVRSSCAITYREHASVQSNDLCGEQELILQRDGEKKITRRLLEHEPWHGEYHLVTNLRCVAIDKKYYLLASISNRGSCEDCETTAILDLNGKWKRYGERWYATPKSERAQILKHEKSWYSQEYFRLTNTVPE